MTQPQTRQPDAAAPIRPTDAVTLLELARVTHQTPGLVVVQQDVAGALVMTLLSPVGELQPVEITRADSGTVLTWADLAVSSRVASVSGWFPGKLGGWVKLDWRDGGFVADAWSSDGAGMTTYDTAMRAAKKRG